MLTLISQAWRSWKSTKGIALFAVLALTVGIGGATAILTLVDTILFKPLAYSNGDRWIALFGGSGGTNELDRYSALSYSDVLDYQERTRSFDAFGAFTIGGDFNLTSPGPPEHVNGVEVSPSLIGAVNVNPIVGRVFSDSDGQNVVLISERLWNRFGSDRAILGKGIELNGVIYTVTGVMPSRFRLPVVSVSNTESHDDVWIPLKRPTDEGQKRNFARYACYARLKPGVAIESARADAKRVASEIVKENPGRDPSYTAVLFSLRDFAVKSIRPVLLLLLGAAGLLLLLTCANVSGLLVTRSAGRAREIAVRVALGASRKHLATQFIFEGLFISLAAAVLGTLASIWLVRYVVSFAGDYIPRADEVSVNWRVLFFALGLGCLAALASALAPLWQALRSQPNDVLNEGIRASASTRSRKISQMLVVAEIAVAFTLISVSALLIAQLNRLNRVWPGFDPNGLVTFQLRALDRKDQSGKTFLAYQRNLVRALEAVPGVSGTAFANQLPLVGRMLPFHNSSAGRQVIVHFGANAVGQHHDRQS